MEQLSLCQQRAGNVARATWRGVAETMKTNLRCYDVRLQTDRSYSKVTPTLRVSPRVNESPPRLAAERGYSCL